MVQYELLNVTHDLTYWPFCIGSLGFWKSWFSFFLPETVHVDKLPEEFQCCLGPGVYQRHIFEGHFTHFFEFANIFYGQSCPHLKSNQIL